MDEKPTISELMERDPLQLTTEDLDQIVAYFREKRALFNLDGARPKAKASSAEATQALLDLGL